jgi:hypothetical protein
MKEEVKRIRDVTIDARSRLQVEGSLSTLTQAIAGLIELQKTVEPDRLTITTVSAPITSGIIVELRFSGSISKFGDLIAGLDRVRKHVAFSTVPSPAIGTWPTPECPFGWTLGTTVESKVS